MINFINCLIPMMLDNKSFPQNNSFRRQSFARRQSFSLQLLSLVTCVRKEEPKKVFKFEFVVVVVVVVHF